MSIVRGRGAINPLSATGANDLLEEMAKGIRVGENLKCFVVRRMDLNQLHGFDSMGDFGLRGNRRGSFQPRCRHVPKSKW